MSRSLHPLLCFVLFTAGAAFLAYPLLFASVQSAFIVQTHFIVLTTLCLLVIALAFHLSQLSLSKLELLRRTALLLWCILAVSTALTLANPRFRVFSDELELASTAQGLYLFNEPIMLNGATISHGEVVSDQPIHPVLTIRPALFPTLLALLHKILGYSVQNAFRLNLILTVTLVFLIANTLHSPFGSLAALITPLVLLSQPLLVLSGSSGHFDLLTTLLWVAIVINIARLFSFRDKVSADLFWILLALFAHCRFESVLYSAVFTASILIFAPEQRILLLRSPFWALLPFLIAPVVWQRALQGAPMQAPAGDTLFSIAHFYKNNLQLFKTFLPGRAAYNCITQSLGFLSLAYILLSKRSESTKKICLICLPALFCYWVLITSFFWSSPDDPLVYRHYLPLVVFLSWAGIVGVLKLLHRKKFKYMALVPLTCVMLVISMQKTLVLSERKLGRFGERYNAGLRTLAANCADLMCQVQVEEMPLQYTLHGYSSYLIGEKSNNNLPVVLIKSKKIAEESPDRS